MLLACKRSSLTGSILPANHDVALGDLRPEERPLDPIYDVRYWPKAAPGLLNFWVAARMESTKLADIDPKRPPEKKEQS